MTYTLNFSRQGLKDLEKIGEPYYSNIKQAVFKLADNPRPQGCKKLKGQNGYRIRIGVYRVVYEIFDNVLVIDVVAVGHRKEIYD